MTRLNRIGIQLYAVRTEAAKDLERTLADLAAIGYNDVEWLWSFNNLNRTPKVVRAMLDRVGLKSPSTHAGAGILSVGWERHLDAAATIGHEYVIIPSFNSDEVTSLDDWKEFADRFNAAGAVARKHGIWLGFHTEPNHFGLLDGGVPYDAFMSRVDPSVTRHQLDMGNASMAGVDPMSLLTKYRDKFWSFHVKDVPVMGKNGDTTLGDGVVDLRRILAAIPSPETKRFFIEQGGGPAPMEGARKNYAYLKALEF
jgi:sugar phosphate isomerase/epimerase